MHRKLPRENPQTDHDQRYSGRWDAHSTIEDTRGTLMPLDVQTNDGRSGTIYIAMADDSRRSTDECDQYHCGFGS